MWAIGKGVAYQDIFVSATVDFQRSDAAEHAAVRSVRVYRRAGVRLMTLEHTTRSPLMLPVFPNVVRVDIRAVNMPVTIDSLAGCLNLQDLLLPSCLCEAACDFFKSFGGATDDEAVGPAFPALQRLSGAPCVVRAMADSAPSVVDVCFDELPIGHSSCCKFDSSVCGAPVFPQGFLSGVLRVGVYSRADCVPAWFTQALPHLQRVLRLEWYCAGGRPAISEFASVLALIPNVASVLLLWDDEENCPPLTTEEMVGLVPMGLNLERFEVRDRVSQTIWTPRPPMPSLWRLRPCEKEELESSAKRIVDWSAPLRIRKQRAWLDEREMLGKFWLLEE
ncbi:hypothetical protein ONZ45_g12398 [Pleurotus djamor]|nr:hypothetical protein ONZ45_g12398 [Pleurotus djamor]